MWHPAFRQDWALLSAAVREMSPRFSPKQALLGKAAEIQPMLGLKCRYARILKDRKLMVIFIKSSEEFVLLIDNRDL